MNHATRKAATALHASRRRVRLTSVFSGPTDAIPPAATALDVPTAGVPTYLAAASELRVAAAAGGVFCASDVGGLGVSVSGPAIIPRFNRPYGT
jgi:hypothetical protein